MRLPPPFSYGSILPMSAKQYVTFLLRFPHELRAQIKQAAVKSRRSIHAEILFRLEQGFEKAAGGEFADLTPAARINETALPGGLSITHGNGDALDDYSQR